MQIEFLVEDISGRVLLEEVMKKYIAEEPAVDIGYTIFPYKGIGGFTKGSNVQNVKSQQLLTDLPKRMRAIQSTHYGRTDVAIFVVLDNDKRDTAVFEQQLKQTADRANISMDHVFCIAIEEMEAWLLGDRAAMQRAYPEVADRIATKSTGYVQDSICGTWEILADVLTKGGISSFRKKNPSSVDVGRSKSEWANNIGCRMNIRCNNSPSFQRFLQELDKRRELF